RRLPESAAAYQEAIDLQPRYAGAYYNLGHVLAEMGRPAEAAASYRRAVALEPDFAWAWMNLGIALKELGRFDDAAAAFRTHIKQRPTQGAAPVTLGLLRLERGEFAAALADLKRGHPLLAAGDPYRALVGQTIQDCARLVQLEARLPAVLRGEDKPADNAE